MNSGHEGKRESERQGVRPEGVTGSRSNGHEGKEAAADQDMVGIRINRDWQEDLGVW